MILLSTPLSSLPGVGPTLARRLSTLGLETAEDLLSYFPFRYDDFSAQVPIADLELGVTANIVGRIEVIRNKRSPRRRMNITEALVTDDSDTLRVVWFNQPFLTRTLPAGTAVSLSGRLSEDYAGPVMLAPAYETLSGAAIHTQGIVPVYSLTAGVTQKQLRAVIARVLPLAASVPDPLPESIRQTYGLLPLAQAIRQIHFPEDPKVLAQAKRRLGFDELLELQLRSLERRRQYDRLTAPAVMFRETEMKEFASDLPFVLTAGQKHAAWEIIQDMGKTVPMLRLLQGDVGSGKTVVASLAAYLCALDGRQTALMVPTELLAHQHFKTLSELIFAGRPVAIALLTSGRCLLRRADGVIEELSKPALTRLIAAGECQIVIGTHALIQDPVSFHSLALAVIDEQHRFGVEQRGKLAAKAGKGIMPHLVAMTATPIPRSLALGLYGDLDVSAIRDLPPGRQPVLTKIVEAERREAMYEFIRGQLDEGRQAFVICPLIDPSDKLGARSVKDEYERLAIGPFKNYRLGMMHGRLSAAQREAVMEGFAAGRLDMLVSTSIVEIGIDVPNASVMAVEDADRFGLAQLHQYRGRVGRGPYRSYCFLLSSAAEPRSRGRLEAMEKLDNGFDLAEADLQFRGPGEAYGLAQSGWPELKMANFYDTALVGQAREAARAIMKTDPALAAYPGLRRELKEEKKGSL